MKIGLSGKGPNNGILIAQLNNAAPRGKPAPGGLGGSEPMVKTFCTSGEREAVKGAVHALGGVLAATMAAYNIAAWCYRRETHLGINAVVYTLAIIWEIKQTVHHLERCDFVTSDTIQAA